MYTVELADGKVPDIHFRRQDLKKVDGTNGGEGS